MKREGNDFPLVSYNKDTTSYPIVLSCMDALVPIYYQLFSKRL